MNMNDDKQDQTRIPTENAPKDGISIPAAVLMTIFIAILSSVPLFASNVLSLLFVIPHMLAASALAYLTLRLGDTKKVCVWTAVSTVLSYMFACAACALLAKSMPSAVTEGQTADGTVNLFVYALYSLVYFLPGLALFISVKHKYTRSSAVVAVTSALLIIVVIFALASIYASYGTFSPDGIRDRLITDVKTELEPLKSYILEFKVQTEDGFAYVYNEETADALINSVIILFPAAAVCILWIAAYITTAIFAFTAKLGGIEKTLPSNPWRFTMNIVSAYVYVIVYFCGILTASQTSLSVLWAVSQNLLLMLTPGFILIGFRKAFGSRRTITLKAFILPALLLLALIVVPTLFIYLIAAIGVIEVFRTHYHEKFVQKRNDSEKSE